MLANKGYQCQNEWRFRVCLPWQINEVIRTVLKEAHFIAAWALEKIANKTAGALVGRSFAENYMRNEGFNARTPLLNVNKMGGYRKNLALMYDYGALVWEQLRQKLREKDLFTGLGQFFKQYDQSSSSMHRYIVQEQHEVGINLKEIVRGMGFEPTDHF